MQLKASATCRPPTRTMTRQLSGKKARGPQLCRRCTDASGQPVLRKGHACRFPRGVGTASGTSTRTASGNVNVQMTDLELTTIPYGGGPVVPDRVVTFTTPSQSPLDDADVFTLDRQGVGMDMGGGLDQLGAVSGLMEPSFGDVNLLNGDLSFFPDFGVGALNISGYGASDDVVAVSMDDAMREADKSYGIPMPSETVIEALIGHDVSVVGDSSADQSGWPALQDMCLPSDSGPSVAFDPASNSVLNDDSLLSLMALFQHHVQPLAMLVESESTVVRDGAATEPVMAGLGLENVPLDPSGTSLHFEPPHSSSSKSSQATSLDREPTPTAQTDLNIDPDDGMQPGPEVAILGDATNHPCSPKTDTGKQGARSMIHHILARISKIPRPAPILTLSGLIRYLRLVKACIIRLVHILSYYVLARRLCYMETTSSIYPLISLKMPR